MLDVCRIWWSCFDLDCETASDCPWRKAVSPCFGCRCSRSFVAFVCPHLQTFTRFRAAEAGESKAVQCWSCSIRCSLETICRNKFCRVEDHIRQKTIGSGKDESMSRILASDNLHRMPATQLHCIWLQTDLVECPLPFNAMSMLGLISIRDFTGPLPDTTGPAPTTL